MNFSNLKTVPFRKQFLPIVTTQPIHYHQAPSSGALHVHENISIRYKMRMLTLVMELDYLSPFLWMDPPL